MIKDKRVEVIDFKKSFEIYCKETKAIKIWMAGRKRQENTLNTVTDENKDLRRDFPFKYPYYLKQYINSMQSLSKPNGIIHRNRKKS